MTEALATLANAATTATTHTIDVTAADMFGGFLVLAVGIVSFLCISGLALSMTIGASKSPGTMAITGIAGVLSVIIALGLYMSLSTNHHGALAKCPGLGWDTTGGIIALVMGVIAFLSLGGIAVIMTIGAFMPNKSPMTSWPMNEEQAFAGFERRSASSQSRAWVFSVAAGVFVFVGAFGIYKGVTPDIKDLSKDMNMSNLTKKSKTEAPAAKPDAPKPEAAPKADPPKPEAAPKAE